MKSETDGTQVIVIKTMMLQMMKSQPDYRCSREGMLAQRTTNTDIFR